MKIIQNTPTRLRLRSNLALYRFFDLLIAGFFLTISISTALIPGQVRLQCQKTNINTECKLTIWDLPHLHSQTNSIQLQGARVENNHDRKGDLIVLETAQGGVKLSNGSLDGVEASAVQQEIHSFLAKPDQAQLDITLEKFVLMYCIFCLLYLTYAGFKLFSLLRSPFLIKWAFVSESDMTDPSNDSGTLHGTLYGIFWKKQIHYPFSELIKLNTDIITVRYKIGYRYRLNLQLRRTSDLPLSPEGLSASKWREITRAVAPIINTPVPDLPVSCLDRLFGK
jgi:hypothetical protein